MVSYYKWQSIEDHMIGIMWLCRVC